jgi:7-dehydrocholesterol reductase
MLVAVIAVMASTFLVAPTLGLQPLRWPTVVDVQAAMALIGVALTLSSALPGRQAGPTTECGYVPLYHKHGLPYFLLFLGMFEAGALLGLWTPTVWADTFVGVDLVLQGIALALCLYLHEVPDRTPTPHASGIRGFFWGRSLHPKMCGFDVKQLVNSRIGMMYWGLLACSYAHVASGDVRVVCCACAQLIYIGKFFAWERGYFYTLDIMHDRAGYYLLWGCLVWVPHLYALPVRALVAYGSTLSDGAALALFAVAVTATMINYEVDFERRQFRDQPQSAQRSIKMTYQQNGETVETRFLVYGWWGRARHINYFFELVCAWCWGGFAGSAGGMWPFVYPAFLTILLLHRIRRDEERCARKYGTDYDTYRALVPYRLVPYVV